MTIANILLPLRKLAVAVALAAVSSGAAAAASPADRVFTVANYPVEAEAASAVAAKDKALAEGQDAAFRSLLKRLVPVTSYGQLARFKDMKTGDLLDGVRSRSEQNSATRYIASFDFAFQPDAVREVLQREGVPFVADQAPQVLLVPVMAAGDSQSGKAGSFAPASPLWNEAWKGLDLDNALSPARLTPLKPEIHADTMRMLLSGDGSADGIMETEYKSALVVAAVADVDSPGKQVTVTLAGRDAVGAFTWSRTYKASDGDTGYAMELAAVVGLGVLEGRWKAARSGAAGVAIQGQDVEIEVVFKSQDEWNTMRGRILDLEGVDDVRVGAISDQSAQMGLKYPGGGAALASALALQGLTLRNAGNQWQLRAAY